MSKAKMTEMDGAYLGDSRLLKGDYIENVEDSDGKLDKTQMMMKKLMDEMTILKSAALSSSAINTDLQTKAEISARETAAIKSESAILVTKVSVLETFKTRQLSDKIMNTAAQIILFLIGDQPLKLSSKGAKSKFQKEEAKAKAAAVDVFISNFSTQADELILARNILIHPSSKDVLEGWI